MSSTLIKPSARPARTGRSRADSGRIGKKQRTRAAAVAPARFIPPMKELSVDTVPAGRWRLEVKLDGYRAVAVCNGPDVELWSRNVKPMTADYPEVVAALQGLKCTNAVIDGEIVALDAQGRSRFQLLQGRGLRGASGTIVYYVFDLLHLNGESLIALPIEERQRRLETLVGKSTDVLRVSPVFDMKPEALLAAVRKQGLEGIIAKAPASPYEPDRRSGLWLKCKVHGEQEFVIGGFTPPKNSRPYFGALLVGYYDRGQLIYAGKVGSGFGHARLKALYDAFMQRSIGECPFANLPSTGRSRFGAGMTRSAMREVTWVQPELVAQVRFTEWTDDGLLRHPVFLGLRNDKRTRDVVREAPPAG
jgi:bifunctional non-homologous end joining protein LigD